MPLESRNRMVSFRLSDDEYIKFRELCFTTGIRSISEMARVAISTMLQEPNRVVPDTLDARVSDIESRLRLLALEVKRLADKRNQVTP